MRNPKSCRQQCLSYDGQRDYKKFFRGVVHKTVAASTIERSISRKLEERMTVTKNNK